MLEAAPACNRAQAVARADGLGPGRGRDEGPRRRGARRGEGTGREPRRPSGEWAQQSVEDATEQAGAQARRQRAAEPGRRVSHPETTGVLIGLGGDEPAADRHHLGGQAGIPDLHHVEDGRAHETLDLDERAVHPHDTAGRAGHAHNPSTSSPMARELVVDERLEPDHGTTSVRLGDDVQPARARAANDGPLSHQTPRQRRHPVDERTDLRCLAALLQLVDRTRPQGIEASPAGAEDERTRLGACDEKIGGGGASGGGLALRTGLRQHPVRLGACLGDRATSVRFAGVDHLRGLLATPLQQRLLHGSQGLPHGGRRGRGHDGITTVITPSGTAGSGSSAHAAGVTTTTSTSSGIAAQARRTASRSWAWITVAPLNAKPSARIASPSTTIRPTSSRLPDQDDGDDEPVDGHPFGQADDDHRPPEHLRTLAHGGQAAEPV